VEGDDNAALDVATERLAAVGHPTVRLDLADTYDIGAEFFRWEFATAVAGMLLGVQPFDQPNVQAAKDATDRVLSQLVDAGNLPETEDEGSVPSLLEQAEPGDYVALMAYVEQTNGVDGALLAFRKQVMENQKLATTMGYGPRFLHSTGQLHKGGPASGLFVQLVDRETALEIPGEEYGFHTLVSAQAMGDYQALRDAGRRVVRIDLGEDAEGGLLRLLATL
jgi:glucose-6-phosphate isomerase/transaldolase/glucose-6-phosphate isomerase